MESAFRKWRPQYGKKITETQLNHLHYITFFITEEFIYGYIGDLLNLIKINIDFNISHNDSLR